MGKNRNKTVAQTKRRKIIVEPLEPRTLFSADVVSASLALDLTEDNSTDQHNWLANTGTSEFTVSNDKGDAYPAQKSAVHERVVSALSKQEAENTRSELVAFEEQASDVFAELNSDFKQSHQIIFIDARVDDSDTLL